MRHSKWMGALKPKQRPHPPFIFFPPFSFGDVCVMQIVSNSPVYVQLFALDTATQQLQCKSAFFSPTISAMQINGTHSIFP